jgi:GcrA cell cycle regulator
MHNNRYAHDWTDARIAELKEPWLEGYSASECATRLGGITRNSVIGKIHRLGLSGSDRKRRVTSMRNPRKAAAAQLLETSEQPVSRSEIPQMRSDLRPPFTLTLLELRPGMCRWPHGDRAPYRFCGAEQAPSSSYCEDHRRLSMSGSKLQPVHFNVKKWGTAA